MYGSIAGMREALGISGQSCAILGNFGPSWAILRPIGATCIILCHILGSSSLSHIRPGRIVGLHARVLNGVHVYTSDSAAAEQLAGDLLKDPNCEHEIMISAMSGGGLLASWARVGHRVPN